MAGRGCRASHLIFRLPYLGLWCGKLSCPHIKTLHVIYFEPGVQDMINEFQSAKYFLCAGNYFLPLMLAREQIMLQNCRLKAAGFYF